MKKETSEEEYETICGVAFEQNGFGTLILRTISLKYSFILKFILISCRYTLYNFFRYPYPIAIDDTWEFFYDKKTWKIIGWTTILVQ